MDDVTIRSAFIDDSGPVAAVVAAALAGYPHWVYAEPDPAARARAVSTYYRADMVDLIGHGATEVAEAAGRIVAAAVWVPWEALPDAWDGGAVELLDPPVAARLGRALEAMAAAVPEEPHSYLDVLAVHPDWQGQGLGTLAAGPGIRRTVAAGRGCYLDTAHAENLAFYRRLGFEVVSEVSVDGLVPWGRWRSPRPFVSPGTSNV